MRFRHPGKCVRDSDKVDVSAKILLNEAGTGSAPLRASSATAWQAIGWFGLLLGLIGLADALINWYPLAWRSAEWEFATIATTFGALPLVTMGLAALLGSFLARGVRWGVVTMAVVLLLTGLVVFALLGLFALDVPLALKASAGSPASLAIRRGVARTAVLGLGFGMGYLAAAIISFRSLRRRAQV